VTDVRVAVVGSGFAGIGMAVGLRRSGVEDFVVLERAGEVGGTWRDNAYPGCACDVPSQLYSFSHRLNPRWSRSFAPQGEILDYLRSCARTGGVEPHLRLGHDVRSMRFDAEARCWLLDTTGGPVRAEVVVAAVGALSEPRLPDVPGIERFGGAMFHSAAWDHRYDLTGKKVAVVGTGASSIQFIPQIQPLVDRLVLFQRSAPWVLPRRDRAIGPVERAVYRHVPGAQRLVRAAIYWGREGYVLGFARRPGLLRLAQRVSLAHLRRQVPDEELRAVLTPRYTMGCKRILLSDDYYPALSRPNVEVVGAGVAEVREHAVVGSDGSVHDVDAVIFGTGFHVTDFPAAAHIHRGDGTSLAQVWREGMEAYKGTTVAGFPNLFFLVGPNTGLGHSSMVFMIESQVAYVLDALRTMERRRLRTVDVDAGAQARFNAGLVDQLAGSVWNTGGCHSWYLDARGRNTTLWPGFSFEFRRQTRRFDVEHYRVEERPDPDAPPRPAASPVPAGAGADR